MPQSTPADRPRHQNIGNEIIPGVSRSKGLFLLAGFLSFLMSVTLWFSGNKDQAIFVGLWVPSILSAGSLLLGGDGHG
jgi:hypothetical protein